MVLTIELSEEVERSLLARAEREGKSVEGLSVEILKGSVSRETVAAEFRNMSPAQIMDYWEREGLVGWRDDVEDSAVLAREIRDKAQRRVL